MKGNANTEERRKGLSKSFSTETSLLGRDANKRKVHFGGKELKSLSSDPPTFIAPPFLHAGCKAAISKGRVWKKLSEMTRHCSSALS